MLYSGLVESLLSAKDELGSIQLYQHHRRFHFKGVTGAPMKHNVAFHFKQSRVSRWSITHRIMSADIVAFRPFATCRREQSTPPSTLNKLASPTRSLYVYVTTRSPSLSLPCPTHLPCPICFALSLIPPIIRSYHLPCVDYLPGSDVSFVVLSCVFERSVWQQLSGLYSYTEYSCVNAIAEGCQNMSLTNFVLLLGTVN